MFTEVFVVLVRSCSAGTHFLFGSFLGTTIPGGVAFLSGCTGLGCPFFLLSFIDLCLLPIRQTIFSTQLNSTTPDYDRVVVKFFRVFPWGETVWSTIYFSLRCWLLFSSDLGPPQSSPPPQFLPVDSDFALTVVQFGGQVRSARVVGYF